MNLSMDDMLAIVKPHNDKLISEGHAAELLAVLKEILAFIDEEGPSSKEWEAISAACVRAHAAIARAEGRTP